MKRTFRSFSAAVTVVICHSLRFVFADGGDLQPVSFAREVLPILSEKCFVCHGPDGRDAEVLRLDSFEEATRDRGGYRVINPQQPEKSEILDRIHSADQPMPPADAEKQLTQADRNILRRWVQQGGQFEMHWAFVRPVKQPAPNPQAAEGSDIIDAFLRQQLVAANLDFAQEADAATLARRVALVLTGLPPEPEILQSFLIDDQPGAYERLVDRLLDAPHFGEHQARYWLDAVRYGDTHGLHLDNRRGIFPFRDWVVNAFNRNLPLDDFIVWQLAGDLLPDPTREQLAASGYVRLNPSTGEGGAIEAEFQMKNNFDRVETLGTVFLGMSLTCARCHSHKYDPVSQTEYFQLLAFFNNTAEPALDGNKYEYGPVAKVPQNQAAWNTWHELSSEQSALLGRARAAIMASGSAEELKLWDSAPRARQMEMLQEENGPLARLSLGGAAVDLATRIAAAEADYTTTLVARDLSEPRPTYLLRRGEYDLPQGDPLSPGTIQVLGGLPADAPANRLGLAKWLTSPDHPLVARVLVNRLWQNTFGHGLVRTPEEFGLQGQQPTHPELMDWLAVELQDTGWNLKHMLRLMVGTRAFRQSSAWRSEVEDPENRLVARGPGYRLDAEVLRDIGLWASGLLDPQMGGEGVKPYQPAGMWEALAHPASNTREYVRDQGPQVYRRSLYVYWKRTSPHPMMTLFDAPDRESSCVRRSRSSTPLQSLGMFNETQRVEMSRMLAQRLILDAADTPARLKMLFTLLTSRPPEDHEHRACEQLLQAMHERYRQSEADAIGLLSAGDAARDPSLDPALHAAWTQVCATVLASDLNILIY